MDRELTLSVAAQLLDYPAAGVADRARAAADWLDVGHPDAAAHARRFAEAVESLSLGALEETYTAAFDFASVGTLYAGEHVFGASQARASFLSRLQVLRREHGLGHTLELPDHLAELLRLAAAMAPGDERDELLRDAALPTARAALEPLAQKQHPYAEAVAAVIAVVETVVGVRAEPARPARVAPRPNGATDDEGGLFDPSPEVAR